jgi:hypothetical protein
VRRRAPIAATIAAAAAIVAFAGVAAARLLSQRGTTWASSAGAVAIQNDTTPSRASALPPANGTTELANAESLVTHNEPIAALRMLQRLHVSDSSAIRYAADSVIAVAALRGAQDELAKPSPASEALRLIVDATTAAIDRAHPGTAIVAPLSLARAGVCVGGHLDCPAEDVREDLAWALLLGTPTEQDDARRLRAALIGDTLRATP